jgi:hypothetical protein
MPFNTAGRIARGRADAYNMRGLFKQQKKVIP